MKLLPVLFVALLCSAPAFAQVKPPVPAPHVDKPLPASIEIKGADIEIVNKAQLRLRNAQLEAENLRFRIEQELETAKKRLAQLEDAAKDERYKWQVMISGLTKLPIEKLGEYEMQPEKDGKIVLTRKGATP